MNENDIEAGIRQFIRLMLIERPFYGDILLRIPIIRDDSVPTACTDGRVIRWSESFFRTLTPQQRNYVLMHEVFHVLLMHPFRLEGKDHELWNIATDIIVNQMCDKLGGDLGRTAVPELRLARPPAGVFKNVRPEETADNLYGIILKDNRPRRSLPMLRRTYTGIPHSDELTPPVEKMPLPDLIPSSLSDEEKSALEAAARQLIREAAKHQTAGTGPSCFIPRELTLMAGKKPISWKTLLREFLTEVESDETSYATPERKYLHMELILPGHSLSEDGELESVWAFVDSSGSISEEEMNRFLTELYRLVRDFRCEMNIAYWDTSVTDVYRKIRREKDVLKAVPKHSGGTDINCVYQWVRANKVRPYVSVILTDGYFGVPNKELAGALPARSTILVISNDSRNPVYSQVGKVARLADL